MKKTRRILWGIIFIVIGVLIALEVLNVLPFPLFFDGWWTLFIILPSLVGLITDRRKSGNAVSLAFGVCLLLAAQGVFAFSLLWKLLIPAVIVWIGCKMIFGTIKKQRAADRIAKIRVHENGDRSACATFAGADMIVDGEVFEGATLTAVFGGVKCDLRNAVIEKDCIINVSAIFGGIDIIVSDKVNVETDTTCIFGGVGNKTRGRKDLPTVYVSGTCLFGGVDIK
ncbi:MAG: hypothetical protein IKC31_03100 [Clostridia bacterium]|nr:hypothetical protein [Clostridia bacterium]